MFGNIARIVQQFKQSWSRELEDDAIERACEEAGHTLARAGTGTGRDGQDVPAPNPVRQRGLRIRAAPGRQRRDRLGLLHGPRSAAAGSCCKRSSRAARRRWPSASATPGCGWAIACSCCDGSSFSMPDTDELQQALRSAGRPGGRAAAFPRPTGWRWSTLAAACFRR